MKPGARLTGGQTYFHLTPDQFADIHTATERSPEQRMCAAHLADAFADACTGKRADRLLARDWIRGIIRGRVSFDLCCEALHLEPAWLRRRLLKRIHQADLPPIKRPRRNNRPSPT